MPFILIARIQRVQMKSNECELARKLSNRRVPMDHKCYLKTLGHLRYHNPLPSPLFQTSSNEANCNFHTNSMKIITHGILESKILIMNLDS